MEKIAIGALSPSAERRLARGFLIFPALSLAVAAALLATFLEPVAARMGERFLSEKAVPVFRAGLALLALLCLVPWLARRSLSAILRPAVLHYSRFDPSRFPAPDSAPSLDRALLLATLGLGLFFLAAGFFAPEVYLGLIAEDGIVESGSSLAWFVAAACIATGWYRRPHASAFSRLAYGFLFLFFFVCGGEEISWGQRLFGFEGPEALLEVNKQKETNLHNIGSISLFANAIFLFSLVFFLFVPRLLRRDATLAAYLRYLGLPRIGPMATRVFMIGLLAWFLIGIRYGTLGFHPYSLWGHYTQSDDELFEFFMAFSFMAFALLDAIDARKSRK
jgi:hypothetical protein